MKNFKWKMENGLTLIPNLSDWYGGAATECRPYNYLRVAIKKPAQLKVARVFA
jgi:hypothetical protein